MRVLRIKPEETYYLRSKMLWPGKSLNECKFPGDFESQTFHLGAYIDDKLVSISSFYFSQNQAINEEFQFQLQGMATLSDYRKRGFSSQLLDTAIVVLKQNQCRVLWCNAREAARGFYEKVGFTAQGDYFDIADIGSHILMVRPII